MGVHMTIEIEISIEFFRTILALKPFMPFVNFIVLVKVCLLSKAESTIWVVTHIRSFISMNP